MFATLLIASALAADLKSEKHEDVNYAATFSHKSVTCDGYEIHVGSGSKDADSEQEEMGYPYAWLTFGDGKRVELFPALEYNQLLPSKDSCGVKLGDGTVVVTLVQSGRPFQDRLAIAFLDVHAHKVLAASRDVGAAKGIEAFDGKAVAHISDMPSDVAEFNVVVKGVKAKTSELTFDWWSTLSHDGSKVVVTVDPKLTWERSAFRHYFKTREAFEKAAKWDGKSYQVYWVYRLEKPDCVYLTKPREAKSSSAWACAVSK